MPRILVFDVNETLLDVQSLAPVFNPAFNERASLGEWFSRLLLYSEAVTLAGAYFDFPTLARATLRMTAGQHAQELSDEAADRIVQGMSSLRPHPEVRGALESLKHAGLRMVALSNSAQRTLDAQIANAGLKDLFERNFSVDSVRRFKPAPEPYRMVASELGVPASELTMVAAHAWDVLGAMQVGYSGAFVARPGKVLFPLGPRPEIEGADLAAVASKIIARQ